MSIFSIIKDVIKPVTKLVDDIHTSEEEKLILKNELAKLDNKITSELLDYETKLIKAQSSVIEAEIKGQSWLQRTWRPLLMTSFTAILVNNFILVPWLMVFTDRVAILEFPAGFWSLLTIGVGGYIAGRSTEKVFKIKNNSA